MANSYFDAILPQSTAVDILNTANDAARSDRSARIAELERELAEIRKQKAQFSEEGEMGKYKFLYDADPSTYTNYRQNLRSAAATEKIQKATEDSTKASELKSALNRNTLELENALIDQQAADAALARVQGGSDNAAIEQAEFAKKRADTAVNRLQRERKELSRQMAERLGISVSDVETDEKKGLKNEFGGDDSYQERNDELKRINGWLDRVKTEFEVDNMSMEPGEKAPKVNDGMTKVAQYRGWVEKSDLSTDEKEKLMTRLAEAEKAIKDFARPAAKGGKGEKLTPEQVKAALQKEVDGKNLTQVRDFGLDKIDKMLKAGVKWKFTTRDGRTHTLESVADELRGGKISK